MSEQLSTAYDPVFRRYRERLPLAFVRALAKKESGLNPLSGSTEMQGAAGILQVVKVVRDGYNERFGTNYTRDDLFEPEICTRVACDLLNRICVAYAKHPSRNLQTDWQNIEFVRLLCAGWNSGYSEAGGVGKVAKYLEGNGIEVTHDNVYRYAAAANATEWLQNDAKQRWQRSVADLYWAQPDRPRGHAVDPITVGLVAAAVGLAWLFRGAFA